jgi:hypothetical protein
MPRGKYTRRVFKGRRKTKKRRGGVMEGPRRPESNEQLHKRMGAVWGHPGDIPPPPVNKAEVYGKVINGENVNIHEFMAVRDELTKTASYDLVTNKENPELFRRITELGARLVSGKSTTPTGSQRGAFVYCVCLKCEHVNCDDNSLPEFQLTKDHQLTNIPHNYYSVLWHSKCQAGGRSDPRLGPTHSGYLPCWLNKKFDK